MKLILVLVFSLFSGSHAVEARHFGSATLKNLAGRSQQLKNLASGARYLVLIAHGSGCPTVKRSMPAISRLFAEYSGRVKFILVNANPQDSIVDLKNFAKNFPSQIPLYKDSDQSVLRELGVVSTTTAVVLDTLDWKIKYFGAISDQITFDQNQTSASHPYLSDALKSLIKGEAVAVSKTLAYGCAISFTSPSM